MLVAKNTTDKRPIGFGASSNNGFYAYKGDAQYNNIWSKPKELGGPYKTWALMLKAHPEINFATHNVCSICGGKSPCLKH